MTVTAYFNGHKAYYDWDKNDWLYVDDNTSVWNKRPCVRCGQYPLKDDIIEADYCLGFLGDKVDSACCGHGVKKGYIKLKDGRIFEEVIDND